MITRGNFKDLLVFLEYDEVQENIFKYHFYDHDCDIEIDFREEKIKYPKEKGLIVNENQTTNFSSNENFVVFECVHRLLLKGYKPNHIELERRWSLGHSQKSGRADICVMNETGTATLFIIECKTYGEEYRKALKILKEDGGQLFSYYQQDKSVNWLSLYASDFVDDEVIYETDTIATFTDEKMIDKSLKDASLKLFEQANTKEEAFNVWTETYESKFWGDVLFNKDTVAYTIGEQPLRKKDLKEFNPDDKIVNQFEEILRHNNVSDKENAFNRLVALFICKLVDEIDKEDDDIVEFQYKEGTDTYETLQDRLQRLHKEGIERFLKEDVFYVESEYPTKLFANYKGLNRKNAIKDLTETFKKLKFYSNNEFAFKDVHNEVLFQQNGKILVEVVKLFERYKIVYTSKHQFLGDLFEQLLNKGFKQNEGQFFTPTPITRFIWESLPIEDITKSEKGKHYPHVIDYACGSGHFLTEGIEVINSVMQNTNNDWVGDYIYGIEKDYRLARVSKISLFMNGAGEGNIIFGDGLDNDESKGIENGKYDILIANPPYSVKAFKSHLELENNDFELLDRISNDGGEIEVLFVERMEQLLKPNGVAGVILPSSILSNNSNSYIGAREIILKNFDIKAIVQFGSKTFSETGTNTVVLFLQKYDEPPKKHEMIEDSIRNIFNADSISEWGDNEILTDYVDHIGVELNDYIDFVKEEKDYTQYSDNGYFSMYLEEFENSTEIKNRKKQKTFKQLDEIGKNIELTHRFYSYVKSIETEKMFYFGLVKSNEVLVITSPSSNNEQKNFLGYDWSKRKGSEGIQIIKKGGMLYSADRLDNSKISNIIRNYYINEIDVSNGEVSALINENSLYDMIDFEDIKFNKAIYLRKAYKIEIVSKYPIIKLKNFNKGNIEIKKGTTITKAETNSNGNIKVVAGGIDYAYNHDQANRKPNVITISASGANAGYVSFYEEEIFASDCTTIWQENTLLNKYLFYYLTSLQADVFLLQKGSGQPHVYKNDIEKIPVPDIPINTVETIFSECKKIEDKYETIRMKIEDYHKQTQEIFEALEVAKNTRGGYKLSDKSIFEISIGSRVLNSELTSTGIPVYSANVFEPFGLIDKKIITNFSRSSVIWSIDGDWMVNILPKDYEFYPTDHCGVLRVNEDVINPRYMVYILEKEGSKLGFSRSFRASIDRIKSIRVQVPNVQEQNKAVEKIAVIEQKIAKLEKAQVGFSQEIKLVFEKYM